MVPKGKEKALMTFDQIVARVKAIPGFGGCLVGEKWEGYTDNQLRVDVFAKKGSPGFTVLWEYHDGEHKHQCGKHSVGHADIDRVVADITAAAAVAVPGRYVHEVEARTAAERDPALAEAARVRAEEVGSITREALQDALRILPEAMARQQLEGQRTVYSTREQVEDARLQVEAEEEQDPALAEAARVQAEGPIEIDVEEGPPPEDEQQEQGDGDPDVEDETGNG